MKKLIVAVLVLCSLQVMAQPEYPNAIKLPTTYKNFSISGTLGIPDDTLTVPTAVRKKTHIAFKGSSLYRWDTTTLVWTLYSSGGGGGGTDNANVGSGFRLLKPGTQELKTLFAGFGIVRDSTTNTNGITDKIDTSGSGLSTSAYALNLYNILNGSKQATLVSATNIKTINGASLLGSGDLTVSGIPHNNNTNLQFKRNGAFTGSDSLNWTASGLEWKGMLIQKNSGGTEQMRIYSDNQVNTFIGYGSGLVNNFAGGGTDNTGVGYETLISNTTGTLNTAVGKRALITVSTGSNNSAVGAGSFQKTTGSNNAGLGFHSGFENTSGQRNSFLGTLAGQNKTTGDDNVLVGYQTGGNASGAFSNVTAVGTQSLIQSTGSNNTAVGYQSLYSNTTGTNNTALGYAAGYGQTGSGNVLIGYLVGLNASTRSNRLMIDNANTDNPLIDGDFNADTLRINGKLYVSTVDSKVPADTSTYAPAWINKTTGEISKATFHYQGSGGGGTPGGSNTQFQYNNSGAFGGTTMGYNNSTGAVTLTGSSNTSQFTIKANSTQSNSNPLFRLQNSAGTDLLWMHSDNAVNTFVGVSSGTANDFGGGGTDNTGYGYETLSSNTTGSLNTAIGKRAMIMNVTGAGNSAVGAGALQKTTGSNNVGLGYHAALENTSGGKNTAIGTNALQNQTTGSENTVVGYQAAGNATGAFSNITAVGTQALIQSTGNNNTAIGYQSLYSNTTGTNNTALGYAAGYGQTGSGNVTIGYLVGLNASTRSNRLMIDNANTDRPLIDGDFNADTLMINGTLYIRTTANKVPADTSSYKPVWINTTTGELAKGTYHYQGAGGTSYSFSSPLSESAGTVSIANAAADGSTKGAASFTANDFNASSGNISLDYTNGQKATASQPGFMTAAQAARLDSNSYIYGSQGVDVIKDNDSTTQVRIKAFQIWDSDTATTTNNTITTVTTITCPNDGAGVLTVTMVGVKTDGTKYLTGEKKIQWTSTGGAVTIRYTTEVAADFLTGFSTATWTVDASGGTLRIRVTGEATENVEWSPSFTMKYHSVAL